MTSSQAVNPAYRPPPKASVQIQGHAEIKHFKVSEVWGSSLHAEPVFCLWTLPAVCARLGKAGLRELKLQGHLFLIPFHPEGIHYLSQALLKLFMYHLDLTGSPLCSAASLDFIPL